jgi:hypothetical protein
MPDEPVKRDRPQQELVAARLAQIPANQPPTLLAYLHAAESGADLARLEKLMDLHERWEDRQALKAFNQAMADFRSESMTILKTKYVDIPGGAKFWQAELGNICDEVIPKMSKYGLYQKWIPRRLENGEEEVSCVIVHALGRESEPTTIAAAPDKSGNKTDGDARTATRTRLQRYTFLMACGLAPKGLETATSAPGADAAVIEKPKDFDLWAEDAKAAAMKGTEDLMTLWKKTPEDLRTYVIAGKKSFWDDCKAVAGKASRVAKAGAA